MTISALSLFKIFLPKLTVVQCITIYCEWYALKFSIFTSLSRLVFVTILDTIKTSIYDSCTVHMLAMCIRYQVLLVKACMCLAYLQQFCRISELRSLRWY